LALKYNPLRSSLGGQLVVGNVTFDSSYVTGGLAFDHTQLGANAYAAGPGNVICNDVPLGASQGRQAVWDQSTAKLIALTPAGVEIANATDLSGMTVRVTVWM
jgi:hypothetical protein